MMKKGITAAVFFVAASSIYAGGVEIAPVYVGGFYADVGLSRDDVRNYFQQNGLQTLSVSINGVPQGSITTGDFNYQIHAGAAGWAGLVGLGYQYVWNQHWSLGAEIYGDFSSAHGQLLDRSQYDLILGKITRSYSAEMRLNNTFGVSVMPGYYFAPGSLYFLDFGYVNSEFKLSGFPTNIPGAFNLGQPASREENESGLHLGFGVNTQVGRHLAVRQEYIWESYARVTARSVQNAIQDAGNGETDFLAGNRMLRVTPSVEKYNLAVAYYFAPQGNRPNLEATPVHVGGHFYLGANASRDEAISDTQYFSERFTLTTAALVTNDLNLREDGRMKIAGGNAGLFAGYGFNFSNRWYTGFELSGNYDQVQGLYSVSAPANFLTGVPEGFFISERLEKNWDFGAAFMPGYQVSDQALLYARVGYVGAEFEIEKHAIGNTGIPADQTARLNFTQNRWVSGLQLGVGVDTLLSERLSLRTEFNVNNFGTRQVSTLLSDVTLGNANARNELSTRYKHIIEDQFNLALIWHFFA